MIKTLTKQIVLLSLLIIPSFFYAATVVISEIGFNNPASNVDYVELYNTTGSAIDLTGYHLRPSTGSSVILTGTIQANSFYLVVKSSNSAVFQASWDVTLGASVTYQNTGGTLENTAGVTFILQDPALTSIDNTTGYGISLGTRLYQCPVGSFAGNNYIETGVSDCTPGNISTKSVDDLTYWTISRLNNAWDVGIVNSGTGSDNLIIKRHVFRPNSTDQINDVYLPSNSSTLISYIEVNNQNFNISGDLILGTLSGVVVQGTGEVTVSGTIYKSRLGATTNLKYNIWTSPFSSNVNILGTFTGINPCDIYTYKATTQEFKSDFSVPFSTSCNGVSVTFNTPNVISLPDGVPDGNMDIGRGYYIAGSSSSPTRTLVGSSFNNGSLSYPIYGSSQPRVDGNDWNLIGNPYPSAIVNSSFLSNINNNSLFNSVYIYNSNGYYETKNSSTVFYIASMQGFFVDAASGTDGLLGNVEFNNSMRIWAEFDWRNINQTIFLSLNDTFGANDPIQIIFDESSEDGFDKKHDSRKFYNPNKFNLATFIDTEWYVFNGIKPVEDYETKSIRLFVQTPRAGNYEISLDSLNLIDSHLDIILEDAANNTFTNLRASSFSFSTPSADSITNRFFIHLTNTVTSTNELENNLNVSIFSSNGILNINTLGETPIHEINIYDVMGRNIYANNKKTDNYTISTTNFNSGIYIVKVTGANGKLTTKRVFIE